MTVIVKIDRATGEVLQGPPVNGDYVRIITSNGAVIEQEWTELPPLPPPSPRELTKTAFREICYAVLGGLAAPESSPTEQYAVGLALFTGYIEQCEESNDVRLRGLAAHFYDAPVFVKDRVELFFTMLVAGGIVTQQQAGAVLAAWPT